MHTGVYGCVTDAYGCIRVHTDAYGCIRASRMQPQDLFSLIFIGFHRFQEHFKARWAWGLEQPVAADGGGWQRIPACGGGVLPL